MAPVVALEEIPLEIDRVWVPEQVDAWIRRAEARAAEFYEAGLGLKFPKYVPSDPRVVHGAMAALLEHGHLRGRTFCEWGCGFGIAAGIAALLGMKAYGIEIEDELADRAVGLAAEAGLDLAILRTDYLPEGFAECEGWGGKDLISPAERTTRGGVIEPPEYDGLDPEGVDLFFVYPWPGQEEMMMDLFTAVASHGAVLLIYLGEGEIAAYRRDESGEAFDADWEG